MSVWQVFAFWIPVHVDLLLQVVSNGIYAGQGADSSVALIRDTGEKMYRSGMTEYVTVKGYVKAVNPPYDLNITLLCYVGVDRCTEDSTAASLPADGANQDTNTQEFPTAGMRCISFFK